MFYLYKIILREDDNLKMFRRSHYKLQSHALKHMNKNPKTDNVALKIRKEAKMYLSAKSKLMHYSIVEHMS